MGHVVRCVALADALREACGARAGFAFREGSLGLEYVERHGYRAFQPPGNASELDYSGWLESALRELKAQVLVTDVRDDLSRTTLAELADDGCRIVVLDDLSERRFAADFAFYPPVPQVSRADWSGFAGRCYVGWEWSILRAQFRGPRPEVQSATPTLLIAMGGSDPAGLTLRAIRAARLLAGDFKTTVVVGAGFRKQQELQDLLDKSRGRFTVLTDVSDMGAVMAQADLAVCSFGMTAYELAAMGVPAIYLCLTPDHAESASAFVEAGMGWSLGVCSEVSDHQLAGAINRLLLDRGRREEMSSRSRMLIDGNGDKRVTEILLAQS